MAATEGPDHENELPKLDWESFRAMAGRRLRARMTGFNQQEIEDAVQDVTERFIKFLRRRGMPEHPDGLLVRIVRAVAANAIERRQRERALQAGDISTWLDEPSWADIEEHVLEQYRLIVYSVLAYFKLKKAGCVPLANAKASGESLKDYATRLKVSYQRERMRWSRCVKLIHEAMRRNRLRLNWPTPRKRKSPDE
jgi:DNA-directed RNA polymerase specialized sigma24 family protein